MLRTGVYLQGRYEILGLIGSGGMSDVYRAKCHKLNRLVAIKVLKEEFSNEEGFVGKFQMEAQAAARLSHPNIVNVYDVVDEGSIHYIVMELIEGITLKSYIGKKGFLDVKEAVGIAIQVAQGIGAAHDQNIVHRDIKPQNMLISKDGKVKVADFGIARAASTRTMTSEAMGSVHYMAPEQARGGYSDKRSDIYSMGITIFEMVTGRLPFEGENTVAVALAQLQEPISRPTYFNPEIPVSLEGVILKCTEKKPEYRYSQISELIADLRRVLVYPDEDFVQLAPEVDMDAGTVILRKEELEEIKRGVDVSREMEWDDSGEDPVPERGSQRDWDWEEEEEEWEQERRRNQGRGSSRGPNPNHSQNRGRRNEREEEVGQGFEKILAALGVVAAVIIVIILVVVFSRLGGLFKFGPRETSSDIQTETVAPTESLNDMEVEMPDVLHLPVDMAESKLKESNLVLKVSGYEDSETVDKGCVISQQFPQGTVVQKYSSVSVVVSNGSDVVNVSEMSLDGMTGEAARLLLEQNKLTVREETEYHDEVSEGAVIRVEPAKAKPGETVTLYISAGPVSAMRAVPKIVDMFEEDAVGLLAASGLEPGDVTEEFHDTAEVGYIIRQGLEPETLVKEGSAVPYTVSLGREVKQYVASVNENYNLGGSVGPGAMASDVNVMIRLKQVVNGETVYKTLAEPVLYQGNQTVPVNFTSIEGEPGVENGEVEVVNSDTGELLAIYPVRFVEMQ
ncbi:MAG: Stk1 family PASTA domain-containing Ser/Thr kinase [Hungatella sp.]|nr:Stk1 family PASTA domain-containing Ser/Thr kinase [Hungatella sp.]